MIPAISQVCTLQASFERDLEDYAAAACWEVELWLGKLETFLESRKPADARRLLEEHRLSARVATYQGGLLSTQGEARREHWQHFARRLALCNELGVETLVVAGDIAGPIDQQTIDRVRVSLEQAAEQAAKRGVRLALEFQARAALANNLESAAAMVAEVGSPHLGLCLDVFHYYTGPSKPEDLGQLTAENLFHVQLSDLAGVPRELAADADRILPGDGDFQLEPIVATLRQIGYGGLVSLELMNPQIWQIPPIQLAEVGMTALRKLIGQASMGAE